MRTHSSFRFASCAAALLMAGCGGVIDERQSSGGASGSGGAGATSSSSVTSTGSGGGLAPCPSTAWSHAYSSSLGPSIGQTIAVDAACNVYVTGVFQGELDFGAGPLQSPGQSLYLAKLDPDGHALWSHSYAVGGWATEAHISLDPSGNILLAGDAGGGVDLGDDCVLSTLGTTLLFVAKLDGDGKTAFCRGFAAQSPWTTAVHSVASNAAGDIILGGAFGGALDFGSGEISKKNSQTGFVLALAPGGQLRWVVPVSSPDFATVTAVTLSPEGVVHAGGDFEGHLDLGLDSAGGADVFVTEIRADGTLAWAHRFGGSSNDGVTHIARGAQGGLVLAGDTEGEIDLGSGPLTSAGAGDVFVARLDAAGDALGGRLYGDAAMQFPYSMAVDEGGNVLLTGRYKGTIDFGGGPLPPASADVASAFIAKLAPDGKPIWSQGISGPDPRIFAAAFDRSGNAVITGAFQKAIEVGTGTLETTASDAILVAKVAD